MEDQESLAVKSEDQEEYKVEATIDHAEDHTKAYIGDYAGFWTRFFAKILDTIIFSVALAIIMLLSYDLIITAKMMIIAGQEVDVQRTLTTSVLTMIVTVLFWKYRSATPGKMMMGVSIVDATTGGAPSTTMLVVRYFAYIVSALPLFLGYIWVAFDKRKQAFHDKIANTVVIVNPDKDDTD